MSKNKKEEVKEDKVKKENEALENTEVNELDELKAKNVELNENLLRSFAEFDNFKKRTSKEKDEMSIYAKTICIKEFLSVLDNFERALAVECKDEDFKKGMTMIFSQMNDGLKKLGAEEIEAMNCKFNPEFHNAINQVEDESFEENTICQVMQKGYKIQDRVIRHSMVVVANP